MKTPVQVRSTKEIVLQDEVIARARELVVRYWEELSVRNNLLSVVMDADAFGDFFLVLVQERSRFVAGGLFTYTNYAPIIRPRSLRLPKLVWELLYGFGEYRSPDGYDYVIVAKPMNIDVQKAAELYKKYAQCVNILISLGLELSEAMPTDRQASPIFTLTTVELGKDTVIVVGSHEDANVAPRHALWAAILLPPQRVNPPYWVYLDATHTVAARVELTRAV